MSDNADLKKMLDQVRLGEVISIQPDQRKEAYEYLKQRIPDVFFVVTQDEEIAVMGSDEGKVK
jgi:hypothetical protein